MQMKSRSFASHEIPDFRKIGKDILPELLLNEGSPRKLVEEKGLMQISDPKEIEKIVQKFWI